MALRLHAVNPEAAEKLLLELELANPDRQEARLIHKHLSNQLKYPKPAKTSPMRQGMTAI
jgi:hypothetical protein